MRKSWTVSPLQIKKLTEFEVATGAEVTVISTRAHKEIGRYRVHNNITLTFCFHQTIVVRS